MGRKVRQTELITDGYDRRVTFKKRRVGLLKKAMELSILAGCTISLSIFQEEDGSLLEYFSENQETKTDKVSTDNDVVQHARFYNEHYNLCEDIDKAIRRYGNTEAHGDELSQRIKNEIQGTAILKMFKYGERKNTMRQERFSENSFVTKCDYLKLNYDTIVGRPELFETGESLKYQKVDENIELTKIF